MANVTFKNGDLAKKAVAKFNGAPIDNGRSKLRLNMIVSAAAAAQVAAAGQDLASRIQALPARGGRNGNRPQQQKQQQQRNAPIKQRGPNRKAALAKKQHQRKPKPAKKSLEDLDKEMAEYFDDKK